MPGTTFSSGPVAGPSRSRGQRWRLVASSVALAAWLVVLLLVALRVL
ncbi:MAG: hypothetical protein MUF48_09695 [Pirellulaceae bacterium]|nr:hypothetical protein [Pirellulaceae bacterium]